MIFREAAIADIPQIQIIRNAVRENMLSNPALVTDENCEDNLTRRGKGWVCSVDNNPVGFAIVDLQDNNVWALFVHPAYEGKGIGKKLHDIMLDWYFSQKTETIWLTTAPGTRAERFYQKAGWKKAGIHAKGEITFVMSYPDWRGRV